MLYNGYNFTQWPDGSIELDSELTPELLELHEGDRFVLQVVQGKLVFRRVKQVENTNG